MCVQYVTCCIRCVFEQKNAFSAGVPPRTRWRAYRRMEEGLLIEQERVPTSKGMGRGEGEAHAYRRPRVIL